MIGTVFSFALASFVFVAAPFAAAQTPPAPSDESDNFLWGKGDIQFRGCSVVIATKTAFGLPISHTNPAIAYFNRDNIIKQTSAKDSAR